MDEYDFKRLGKAMRKSIVRTGNKNWHRKGENETTVSNI
jgi:hypothetical protein